MIKKLSFILALLLATTTAIAQRPRNTVVLSVGEIVSNYGLDSAWVNDTSKIIAHLDSLPQNYVELTNLCVTIRTRAQQAIQSFENDYRMSDSLIWIDSSTVVADYPIYEYRLRRLADLMGRLSIRYSRLEQQRIEAEKELVRQRALEEARRQQDERDRIATDLRATIDLHHRAIITACDGAGISDRTKLKELKDLYYSYLMVYNKYDLSTGPATDQSIVRLDELNAFQNDLLDNVLGINSLPSQIENFKNILKVRCENDNNDVYRSYTRVFKHTSVPITFADIQEYQDYINRMHVIVNVQARYLQTLDLRATIKSGTAAIEQLYGRRYKAILASYREVLASVNQLPAFTTHAESVLFIQHLEDFIAAQQSYIDNYTLLDEISARGDSIVKQSSGKLSDVANAYRYIEPSLAPIPAFKDPVGAAYYTQQLEEVQQIQRCYQEVVALRRNIAMQEDSLYAVRRLDRTLSNGYRLLSRQVDLRPSFATVERGLSFISTLQTYSEMQRLCLQTMHKLQQIDANSKFLTSKDQPLRNIARAYQRVEKSYQAVSEINNTDDLQRYNRQCDYILQVQEAFKQLLADDYAVENDKRLRNETDVDKIRLILGMQ